MVQNNFYSNKIREKDRKKGYWEWWCTLHSFINPGIIFCIKTIYNNGIFFIYLSENIINQASPLSQWYEITETQKPLTDFYKTSPSPVLKHLSMLLWLIHVAFETQYLQCRNSYVDFMFLENQFLAYSHFESFTVHYL